MCSRRNDWWITLLIRHVRSNAQRGNNLKEAAMTATIIRFPDRISLAQPENLNTMQRADILFFTGVRYERAPAELAVPQIDTPTSPTQGNGQRRRRRG
jgi:hypothetical protein